MFDFIMLVGLPASGKTELSKKLKSEGMEIVSSDSIREELYGDESIQGDSQEVFDLAHSRIIAALNNNKKVVLDATNLVAKNRKNFLRLIKEKVKRPIKKECIIIGTPIDICKQRQKMRARKVPDEVIDRMVKSFQFPYYNEGWDKIKVVYNQDIISDIGDFSTFLSTEAWMFDQDNPHHTYTVGVHCYITAKLVDSMTEDERLSKILRAAAEYHDYGKLFTKVIDKKDGIAHYYNHQNYSAYLWVCNAYKGITTDEKDWALIGFLIQNHMVLYNFKTEEEFQKWGKRNNLTQEELFLLSCLHRADKGAK